jgi:periplasmic copper chaperone A
MARRRRAVAGAVTIGVVGAVFWLAGPASAHVTVSASEATPGASDVVITFRVPTESDTASTTGLAVQLPTDTPIASVLVAPHPGWTDTVQTVNLKTPIRTDDGDISQAVSVINWKANSPAAGIKPGQFDEFVIIAGLLPKVNSLTFKAIQTYSDGSQVAWIETPAPGSSAEPEHPAPVLSLAAATGAASTPGASKAAATTGIVLGAIGVVLGAAALAVALMRRRQTPAQPTNEAERSEQPTPLV